MEKHYNNEERLIQDIIERSGLETPSIYFSADVMKKIEATASITATEPLISKRGWILCALLFVGSVVLLYLFPIPNFSIIENLGLSTTRMNVDTPVFTISNKAFYAFLFLALFLIQIPFLKHYLSKQQVRS